MFVRRSTHLRRVADLEARNIRMDAAWRKECERHEAAAAECRRLRGLLDVAADLDDDDMARMRDLIRERDDAVTALQAEQQVARTLAVQVEALKLDVRLIRGDAA